MNVSGNVETHGVNVVNYGTGSSSGWMFGVKSLGGRWSFYLDWFVV